MVNPRRVAVAAAIVAAAVVAVVLGLRSEGAGAPAPRYPLAGTTHVSVSSASFGDEIGVRIAAVVDPGRIDPKTLSFRTDFSPYTFAAPPTTTRHRVGAVTNVIYRARLVCFTEACLPPISAALPVQFPPAQISYTPRGKPPRTTRWGWTRFTVAARTTNTDFQGLDSFSLPPSRSTIDPEAPTYTIAPHTLRVLLFIASAILAVAGLVALVRFVTAGRILRRPKLSALERAVVLVEETATCDDAHERRKALARLSEELTRAGATDLSSTARELAWAESAPVPVGALTVDVRRLIRERSNGHAR